MVTRRWSVVVALFGVMFFASPLLHAERAKEAAAPTSQPVDPERQRWENSILFYGDESTGEWSLRIRDKDVDQQRNFTLSEIWTFDWPSKKWVKMGTTPISTTMVTAAQRPADKQEEDQILVDLPIEQGQMGLFYAKWKVDTVRGSTFFRVGPGLEDKSKMPKKQPPEGKIVAVVPIDIHHAVAAYIPDPRVVCELENSTKD